ncbi:MAG: membrane protein insertase YidC [Deltaproteobacteria bacterium]|nr:membrane protein insertase YidC [Deltaproteobacteria bacterium]
MDKRTLIAIVLSLGILLGYPYVLSYIYPQKPQAQQAQTEKPVDTEGAPINGVPSAQAPVAPAPAERVELTTIETSLFKATFSNHGAGVKEWVLKDYEESIKEDARGINLASSIAVNDSFRTRLVEGGAFENLVFSLPEPATVSKDETRELSFTARTEKGLTVTKKYTVTGNSYIVKTDLSIVNTSRNPFQGSVETFLAANVAGKDKTGYHQGPIINNADGLKRQTEKEQQLSGQGVKWMGLESKYFLSALIPLTEVPINWSAQVPSATHSTASISVPLDMAPGTVTSFSYNSFLGPKEYDLLVNQKLGLEESIEFGYFSFMAKPTLVALNFIERFLGNYGIAIIIITVVIKIVFYPLSRHSLKSMKEMQNLQPQLAAIKEKYKDNKEKMNKELMEVYKRYKVNPLGGCLPMFLQIPVFIALYEVLYVAIELRHAPFFLWIRDLSDKDPYYITPLIMGATMFLQQKMTPSTMDPNQAKIMLIMPVIFTFMFLNFPSGLVIYWLINNILSIAQQYYIQKSPSKVKA